MVTICRAGHRRGLKCDHKRNAESPQGLPATVCARNMKAPVGEGPHGPDTCIFANVVAKWKQEPGVFKIEEVEV